VFCSRGWFSFAREGSCPLEHAFAAFDPVEQQLEAAVQVKALPVAGEAAEAANVGTLKRKSGRAIIAEFKMLDASQALESEAASNGNGKPPFVSVAEGSKLAPMSEERRRKIAGAKAFIQHALANGPQLAEVVLNAAAARDIAEGTLYYAKRALGVTSTHQSYHGPWGWALPEEQLPVLNPSMRRHNMLLTKA
jgi:hypothetical protein